MLQSAASLDTIWTRTFAPQTSMSLWSLPRDFHTCGKNCGKSGQTTRLLSISPDFVAFFRLAKLEFLEKSALLTGRVQ